MDWISIKEALPIVGYNCLVYKGDGIASVEEYDGEFHESVTHWALITNPNIKEIL